MADKLLIPCLYLQSGKAVTGFGQRNLFGEGNIEDLVRFYRDNGADELLVFDFSSGDKEHDQAIANIKQICAIAEIPVMVAGNINRMEDVKKLLYAGCAKVVLNFSKESNILLLEEVSKRFGKEKMVISISSMEEFADNQKLIEKYADEILALDTIQDEIATSSDMKVILHTEESKTDALKEDCKASGIPVITFESAISWSDFKLNNDGLIPVVVQDYKNDQVLMVAYMNEEAFQNTLKTGKMTYWSRSRQELWLKGLTSGHFQYVKSLALDCDNDTILAKVDQIGAACHTGSRSCFFKPLVQKEYNDTNPLHIFQDVYDMIADHKIHPKEGSYTNYLFDKGIDKILKKVGEECAEIIIAAKNPDKEEIKYEISDFLYHAMVLMVEKGVTWEEITAELARR